MATVLRLYIDPARVCCLTINNSFTDLVDKLYLLSIRESFNYSAGIKMLKSPFLALIVRLT